MRIPLMIWFVSAINFVRSIACIIDPAALNSTALWPLRPIGHIAAGLVGAVGAVSAMAWLSWHPRPPWGWAWFLPQLIVLLLGAGSGLQAVARGRYADGTVIPPAHIFTDQIAWVLLPIFYAVAAGVELRHDEAPGVT